tara:strand:+ start:1933 stop:2706 length:774 start_codon:yes stop_codon:yes gene_type:complete
MEQPIKSTNYSNNMTKTKRIRRSPAEIEAGLTVEQKRQGITLEEILGLPPKPAKRIRRTPAEMKAGLTVEQKRQGLTIEDIQNNPPKPKKRVTRAVALQNQIEREKADRKAHLKKRRAERKKARESKYSRIETRSVLIDATQAGQDKMPTRTIFKDRIEEVPVEVPVIKEVRVINGVRKTQDTVEQIMQKELSKCKWEYKEIVVTNFKGLSQLNKLGDQGWQYCYDMDWKLIKPKAWANKPKTLYFKRPKKTKTEVY